MGVIHGAKAIQDRRGDGAYAGLGLAQNSRPNIRAGDDGNGHRGDVGGGGKAVLAFVGTATAASGLLLGSAFLRNVERWKRQANAGQPPDSIGTVALAAAMVLGMEADAVFGAEWQTDALEAERIIRLRRESRQQEAKNTGTGVEAAKRTGTVPLADLSDTDFPTLTVH